MKKIFAFAIALVSMAVSMTSCGNDDADFIERKAPKREQHSDKGSKDVDAKFDGKLYFAVTNDQLTYFNNEYKVQVGDETLTVNVENLQTTKVYPLAVEGALENLDEKPLIYVYTIPAGMKGDVTVTSNWSLKNLELPKRVDMFVGVGNNLHCLFSNLTGLKSERVDPLIARQNSMAALKAILN